MSVIIKLTFPAGRYHATPWGRHVNEGVPEWPPSPWRLLRALVAVWKRTCPEIPETQVKRVLEHLLPPPKFSLPTHRVAHTRHFMPWEKKGPADRTMVFDTFVSVSRSAPLRIGWMDAGISSEDRTALSKFLGNLTSLGRCEGWVHAELCGESVDWNCSPIQTDPNPVQVFCPDPASVFSDEHYPTHDPKKLAKGKVNPAEFLFDCPRWHLCLDTETIHAKRWPIVPGARWVNYSRPEESNIATRAPKVPDRRPTVARFLLDGPVLPLATDTVRIADRFRRAVMSRFGKMCEKNPDRSEAFRRTDKPDYFSSRTFSGKELDGTMRLDHLHAYFLATADGEDPKRIRHVTVYAQEGFSPEEVAALTGMRQLDAGEKIEKLVAQLIGLGHAQDFTAGLFKPAKHWKSVTPFVVHRHLKQRGTKRDTPHLAGDNWRVEFAQLALVELLARLGKPPAEVIPMEPTPGHPRGFEFHRAREGWRDDGYKRPFGMFRINFSEPVSGPLVVGHDSHYGLGLFAAED